VSRRRGLGWLPDDPQRVALELTAAPLEDLIGTPTSPAVDAIDLAPLLDKIPNQEHTSSCVGHAFATSLYLLGQTTKTPIPRPSAKLIYDFARAEDQPYVRLGDYGSRPIAAMRCLIEQGMVAESDWPIVFEPGGRSNINDRPPLGIYQKALGYKVGSYYRIRAGYGAAEAVRLALRHGYVPIFAMPVDAAYQDWDGGVYVERDGPSLGGHMQSTCGYGDGHILVASSWGETHGEDGIVRIADSYFESGEVTDILVPTLVPTF
jgi:hypothetical protein